MGRRNPESAAAAAGPTKPPRAGPKPTPPKPPKPPPVRYTPGTDPDAEEQHSVHEVYERIAPHFAQTRYKVGVPGLRSCPSNTSRTSVLSGRPGRGTGGSGSSTRRHVILPIGRSD